MLEMGDSGSDGTNMPVQVRAELHPLQSNHHQPANLTALGHDSWKTQNKSTNDANMRKNGHETEKTV
jgi:hypothetical protein